MLAAQRLDACPSFGLAVAAADSPGHSSYPEVLGGGFLRLRRSRPRRWHLRRLHVPTRPRLLLTLTSRGGLSVGRTSFDSVHWLKSGPWARPAAYWTSQEQLGLWANHVAAREAANPGREPVLGSAARDSSLSAMASETSQDLVVTCTAPVNIAVIKYCECWRRGSPRPGAGRRTGGRSHRDWNGGGGGPGSRVAGLEKEVIPAGIGGREAWSSEPRAGDGGNCCRDSGQGKGPWLTSRVAGLEGALPRPGSSSAGLETRDHHCRSGMVKVRLSGGPAWPPLLLMKLCCGHRCADPAVVRSSLLLFLLPWPASWGGIVGSRASHSSLTPTPLSSTVVF